MSAKHFILATAGHVDHGKSALVQALTGTDPDRLPEEKARGITIDLGFAHLELSYASGQPSALHLGIVDVPGHEDFVKNMVAGVGSIDLALLVVAADDGWMPQTEEHLQILTYLGVARAVVALTKIDLAQNEADAEARVREKLQTSLFADAPMVKTSVVTNRGLDELKETLAYVLANVPTQRDIGKPRLPIDRVFSLRGVGTVVTGTLTGGTLRRGQEVIVQPSGKRARIRSIQSHGQEVEVAVPSTRTALSLPDLAKEQIQRGEVVTLVELGGASNTLDALLEISPRAKHPLKHGARARVHYGSANVAAHVLFAERKDLAVGQRAAARLQLEAPAYLFAGDRLIVRDWPEQATLAGGEVIDPDAKKNLKSQISDFRLETLLVAQLERDGAVPRAALLVKSRFSAAEIAAEVDRLVRTGKVAQAGEFAADAAWWNSVRQRAVEAIDAEHRAHSERNGLALSELRAKVGRDEVFDALVADLGKSDFIQSGTAIRRATHRPALPPALQAAGAKVRAALAAKLLDPPSRKEIAPDAPSQQALRFLLQTGEAIELGEEVVLLAEAFARGREVVQKFLRERESATASELRQALGSSRRVAIPLLERLDRDGVTLRQGDKRVLRKSA